MKTTRPLVLPILTLGPMLLLMLSADFLQRSVDYQTGRIIVVVVSGVSFVSLLLLMIAVFPNRTTHTHFRITVRAPQPPFALSILFSGALFVYAVETPRFLFRVLRLEYLMTATTWPDRLWEAWLVIVEYAGFAAIITALILAVLEVRAIVRSHRVHPPRPTQSAP